MTKEELFQIMKGTIIVSCQATPRSAPSCR